MNNRGAMLRVTCRQQNYVLSRYESAKSAKKLICLPAGNALKILSFTLVLFVSILFSGTSFADDKSANKKVRLHIGFEHWYSDSFRTPEEPARHLGFGLNYRLPVSWIDYILRYEWAKIKADPSQPDYSEFNDKHIDFITTGFSLVKDFAVGSQSVTLSAMPIGLLWVRVNGHHETLGTSLGYTVDWLFDGRTGIFLDTRYLNYHPERSDGSKMDRQRDVSVIVGVVTRL